MNPARKRGLIALTLALSFGWVLGIFTVGIPWTATARDRDALRAMVTALREGDGSCAVTDDGPKVVCWMESGAVKALSLRPGDVVANRADVRRKHRRTP